MRKLAVLMVAGLVSVALADPIIFNNGSPSSTSSGYSSQLDTNYPFNSQVADDFVLQPGANVITDFHWWGVYWNPGPPSNATAFKIMIYADAGGKPTGAGMPDPTPTALKVWTIPFAQVNEALDPSYSGIYKYDVNVANDPFVATPGQKYWIAFQSVNFFPPQWGWADTGATSGNACQGFPLLNYPYWQQPIPGTTGREMAFYITGVPEPASLLLLGLAGLFLRRR